MRSGCGLGRWALALEAVSFGDVALTESVARCRRFAVMVHLSLRESGTVSFSRKISGRKFSTGTSAGFFLPSRTSAARLPTERPTSR